MTKRIQHSVCAPLAIAASLALGSTQLAAQDTSSTPPPVFVSPVDTSATGQVLPMPDMSAPANDATLASPTAQQPTVREVSVPVVQPVDQTVVAEEAALAEETAQAQTAAQSAESAATTAPVATPVRSERRAAASEPTTQFTPPSTAASGESLELASEGENTPVTDAYLAMPEAPAPAAPIANDIPATSADPSESAIVAAMIAGAVPIALGLCLFMWLRRRSKVIMPVEQAAQMARPEPAKQTASVNFAEPLESERGDEAPAQIAPAMAASTATFPDDDVAESGDASELSIDPTVELPMQPPEDFEERSQLLKAMVDAEPDRANPFRSPKARLRRARLIIQSLGRSFKDAAPRIDLSQYTRNWPHLAGRQYSPA